MSKILNIHDKEDIKKITSDTKYVNVSINNVNMDIINYFLENGANYSYSDSIDNKNGFIYVDYDMFKEGESILNSFIDNMPNNLSEIEKIRYLYISLGKMVGFDINVAPSKNEVISLNTITYLNSVWGALSKRKVTNESLSKIFVYLCSKIGVKCEIVSTSISGELANKVYIENTFIIVNLSKDIVNIKGGFITEYFDKINNDKEMDKKILYIKEEYTDFYLDRMFNNINYNDKDLLYEILTFTGRILDINNINSYELVAIYQKIFDRYVPNIEIKVNNFYLKKENDREHFMVINCNDNYYSYNYSKSCFIKLEYNYLLENIRNKKIGLYYDEKFDIERERIVL